MKHLPEKDNQFYPTPKSLSDKLFSMLSSKKTKYRNILEPSAGKGDLIKSFLSDLDYYDKRTIVFNCCETDKNLCSILSALNNDSRYDSNIKIVGSDFLEFDSIETYDLIIMNPPFKDGDKHLLHALNYVVNGEILCILNAETIKNPFSNYRKILVQKLTELDATITYENGSFSSDDSERKTDVKVALIHIIKKQDIEDVFGADYEKESLDIDLKDGSEVKDINGTESIHDLLDEYNDLKKRIVNTCISMFKASYGCRELFNIGVVSDSTTENFSIYKAQDAIRTANKIIKKRFWDKLLNRDEFKRKLTSKEVYNFHNIINRFSDMEFSYNNINTLYEYMLDNGNDLFNNAIFELFDEITCERSWYPETQKNIYLFNGWKSNNGYKINRRFILIISLYLSRYSSYRAIEELNDIEKIFVYFNNGIYPEVKLSDAYNDWHKNYKNGLTNNTFFENSMFKVRVFKKGTSHFYVKDESLLRRFNVYVSKQRQWLPPDYAMKTYQNCSAEEKRVIDEFEGEKSYQFNLNDPLLANLDKSMLMIEAA
ncbi:MULTISPECIES: DUF4942 domain-containing protein [unclassified Gilliamella]|uniref:DUF4942 domain-containing protein n=1 Tax=unclassified Gilliamella TaxID=2685620 RepID=UPI0018DB1F7F|nr:MULTISPECIES: DUF4942 domain-containing protein [unclassified Gilliamella]MBI0114438.1 DUF4942 domain-containing protein [Gilliamella sp. W8123]MBI0118193.1 DUF4942 domain-containing protein [Gilliamella sp. W8129]